MAYLEDSASGSEEEENAKKKSGTKGEEKGGKEVSSLCTVACIRGVDFRRGGLITIVYIGGEASDP